MKHKFKLMQETTLTEEQNCQDKYFVRHASTHVQSKGESGLHDLHVGLFSLTNQIRECDQFYQMFAQNTHLGTR